MSALPDQVSADAFTPPIADPARSARSICASRSITSGCASRIASAPASGSGCRSCSTPASSRTRRARPGLPNFTGAFVGMACQDLAGTARPADFDWFEYRERDYVIDVSQ